jgi:glycerophosphoryl diester phosphodiesterase
MTGDMDRNPQQTRRNPHLVARRGNAREFPENTIASLRSAIELGASYVEFDVHLSADEVPIVIADESLVRTSGRPESVFELTARELLRIEATERERFDDRFSDIRIPSLEQVTELLAAHPNVTAFVDIKKESLRQFGGPTVVARVSERLKPVRQQCVVISFDLSAVHESRRAGAQAVGWILERYDERSRTKYEAFKPDYLVCDLAKLPKTEARLWRGPWAWVIYGVNSASEAFQLAGRGVEFIESSSVRALIRDFK